ncbi:TPA: helicase-related protein, partial [Clostridioides difficile]
IDNVMKISTTREYRKFKKDSIISISDDIELVGDTTLTKMLYERQLCSQYNKFKLEAFGDLINSTSDRLIVFYNFNEELDRLIELSRDRPISIVNGSIKDLSNYEEYNNSITFVQYQAGAMGLNLQKCNKIVYFSLTLSCELFMQSKKRVHRIGQENTCFYYYMICRNSVEENIYKSLQSGVDYTNNLFERGE